MNQEQKIAKDIVELLNASVDQLEPAVISRLAEARQLAVQAMRESTRTTNSNGGGLLAYFGGYVRHHQRLLSLAALGSAVFFAFLLTQQFTGHGMAEHGDAFLLASELPPEAYLDKGFYSWLEQQ
ncbi:DUF3619 family protein [Methylobacillus gramineus]|uniref:DUF3619 family protein n=1 Tax=Methylobacillus gramineus TaxID=755169 RepID=UPI001CFFD9F8|nr:DUF3619 family protein [Methylobacillus gramineus]MCB5185600.1 DUF3619 family protein [Methylobacillus gramineus]